MFHFVPFRNVDYDVLPIGIENSLFLEIDIENSLFLLTKCNAKSQM